MTFILIWTSVCGFAAGFGYMFFRPTRGAGDMGGSMGLMAQIFSVGLSVVAWVIGLAVYGLTEWLR
jgi:hypothetical protein